LQLAFGENDAQAQQQVQRLLDNAVESNRIALKYAGTPYASQIQNTVTNIGYGGSYAQQ